MGRLDRIAHLLGALSVFTVVALGAGVSPARADGPTFLIADASRGVAVHAWPGGPVTTLLSGRTPLGSPTRLWVLGGPRRGHWGRVVLPLRPNGRTGWIDLRGQSIGRTRTWIIADLSRRRITLLRGARRVVSFATAVGAPSSPTPTGRFSVTDLVLTGDPSGPFGWFAFGLSGHQPNLPPGWSGGDQLAIHGTNAPASIGQAVSAGCLRLTATALRRLRSTVGLGTPVLIVGQEAAAWRVARSASVTPFRSATRRTGKPHRPRVRSQRHRPAAADPLPVVLAIGPWPPARPTSSDRPAAVVADLPLAADCRSRGDRLRALRQASMRPAAARRTQSCLFRAIADAPPPARPPPRSGRPRAPT
jgi:lipoprotein-anchoring transpeptidase ErfK/SrfK